MYAMAEPVDVTDISRADTIAFESFFRSEYPAMVALAAGLTGDRATGEDIAAEALSRACSRWSVVGSYDKPGAWCRRVVINLAVSRRRRLAREVRARMRIGDRTQTDADPPVLGSLESMLAPLPPRQRTAVVLRYVDDQAVADIATLMGCAEGTVKAHLHAARATIAMHLAPSDNTEDER